MNYLIVIGINTLSLIREILRTSKERANKLLKKLIYATLWSLY
jgi:hypothetical protein